MKRKIQLLLFVLSITLIILIGIFVGMNVNKNNISPENVNTENISLEENTDIMVKTDMFSNIIMLVGNTSDDLQAAVDDAISGDTIIISNDIIYTDTTTRVTIPVDKEITIQSDTGNNWTLSHIKSSVRHFIVYGALTLQDLILEGNNKGGGVTVNSDAVFNMNDNVTIQNCYNYDGGAVRNYGMFNMYGATITKCSGGNGGAVRCDAGGEFNIYGGMITDNSSSIGGGVIISYLR